MDLMTDQMNKKFGEILLMFISFFWGLVSNHLLDLVLELLLPLMLTLTLTLALTLTPTLMLRHLWRQDLLALGLLHLLMVV